MLPGFSYQEQHLTCFVCSLIRVYDHVVARWTLEGALSRPILVPQAAPIQHNRWYPLFGSELSILSPSLLLCARQGGKNQNEGGLSDHNNEKRSTQQKHTNRRSK